MLFQMPGDDVTCGGCENTRGENPFKRENIRIDCVLFFLLPHTGLFKSWNFLNVYLIFCVCCSYQLVALKGSVFTQSCSSHWRRSILLDVTPFKSCFFFIIILFVKSERCYLVTIGYWNQRRDTIVDSRTFPKRKKKKKRNKIIFHWTECERSSNREKSWKFIQKKLRKTWK